MPKCRGWQYLWVLPYINANCRVCIGDHMDTVIYAWYLLILLICWAHTITNHHNLIFSQRHQKKIFIIQINVQTSALSKLSQHFPRSIIRAQQRWVIETDTDLNDWIFNTSVAVFMYMLIWKLYDSFYGERRRSEWSDGYLHHYKSTIQVLETSVCGVVVHLHIIVVGIMLSQWHFT